MDVYTKKGDDGTTGLFYGGRVSKADLAPEAYGTVDEAVAALAMARAECDGSRNKRILDLQRQLFVVAAELAANPDKRAKLIDGTSRVTAEMVSQIELWIDEVTAAVGLPDQFIVPGESRYTAALDVARAVVRRAERRAVAYGEAGGLADSQVVPYLNRLADYVYMLVRAAEHNWEPSKTESE
jgi:cob(I)alamin adenosyltransferase